MGNNKMKRRNGSSVFEESVFVIYVNKKKILSSIDTKNKSQERKY